MDVKVKQKYREKSMILQLSGVMTASLVNNDIEGELERLRDEVNKLQTFCGLLVEILAKNKLIFTEEINELLSDSDYTIVN